LYIITYKTSKIMKAISATEFRHNQKYYLDLAKKERIIIQRGRSDAFAIIPLDDMDETEYLLSSPVNAGKLRQAISKISSGEDQGTSLKIDDLWK
jgi:PHD/YefM family antitoxin component YafN of YafNO toxin-antitoxin module